jgi:membrane-associated PAP2 superfamily phosphatase
VRFAPRICVRFYIWHLLVPLAGVALLVWLIDVLRLDWVVSDWFFDPIGHEFPLRDHPFFENVLHNAVKYMVVAFALGVAGLVVASLIDHRWARYRALLVFILAAMTFSSGAVSFLKSATGRHCPYELKAYGGEMPYVGLLEVKPAGVPAGRCWPSGHASTGFCLFAFYFGALWMGRRRIAIGLLVGSLLMGSVLGMGRVAQGAHFVSHNLWSAVVCWLVTLALFALLLRHRSPPESS